MSDFKRDMIPRLCMSPTVLLLSSEAGVRASFRSVLEDAGYLVLPAQNLGTAADLLASCRADLLLTHPYIDNMPGYDAARYLRKRHPGIPVLIVAGLMMDNYPLHRAEVERFEIFPRPFSAEQLLEEVAQMLQRVRSADGGRVDTGFNAMARAADVHVSQES